MPTASVNYKITLGETKLYPVELNILAKAFMEGHFKIIRLNLEATDGLEVHKRLRAYFDEEGNQLNEKVPLIFQVIWEGISPQKLKEQYQNQSWLGLESMVCAPCFMKITKKVTHRHVKKSIELKKLRTQF